MNAAAIRRALLSLRASSSEAFRSAHDAAMAAASTHSVSHGAQASLSQSVAARTDLFSRLSDTLSYRMRGDASLTLQALVNKTADAGLPASATKISRQDVSLPAAKSVHARQDLFTLAPQVVKTLCELNASWAQQVWATAQSAASAASVERRLADLLVAASDLSYYRMRAGLDTPVATLGLSRAGADLSGADVRSRRAGTQATASRHERFVTDISAPSARTEKTRSDLVGLLSDVAYYRMRGDAKALIADKMRRTGETSLSPPHKARFSVAPSASLAEVKKSAADIAAATGETTRAVASLSASLADKIRARADLSSHFSEVVFYWMRADIATDAAQQYGRRAQAATSTATLHRIVADLQVLAAFADNVLTQGLLEAINALANQGLDFLGDGRSKTIQAIKDFGDAND